MGRVAIVTGASSGIGAAAAHLLAEKEMRIVLVGRREEPLEEVRSSLPTPSLAISADLADKEAPERIVERTLEEFGRVDVIVNNAALIESGPLESYSREVFDRHFAINVAAPFFLVSAATEALRRSPEAAVVNVSSAVGTMVDQPLMVYGATKSTLEYFTRAWAYELAEDGIRVNCLALGPVDTPIHATYSDDLDATYANYLRRIPLRKMGHVDDVTDWIWHMVSPKTSWTTGTIIHVDGGQVLGIPPALKEEGVAS